MKAILLVSAFALVMLGANAADYGKPTSYTCGKHVKFTIAFSDSNSVYTARVSVNGGPPETLNIVPTGNSSVYENANYYYYEWRNNIEFEIHKPGHRAIHVTCK